MGNPAWEALGIPPEQIRPGMGVMVAYTASAAVNGEPALICYARVLGLAAAEHASVYRDPKSPVWWLEVHMAPGVQPLPQMFPADQILGIPALGIAEAYPETATRPTG